MIHQRQAPSDGRADPRAVFSLPPNDSWVAPAHS